MPSERLYHLICTTQHAGMVYYRRYRYGLWDYTLRRASPKQAIPSFALLTQKVEKLRSGVVDIRTSAEYLFESNIREKVCTFTTNLRSSRPASKILFLCLPTPPGMKMVSADLKHVLGAAKQ